MGQPARSSRSLARVLALDGLFALVIGVWVFVGAHFAALGQVPPRRPLDVVAYVLTAAAVAALPVRRIRPLVTLAVVVLATATYLIIGYPFGPILIAVVIATYTAAAYLPVRVSLIAVGVSVVFLYLHAFVALAGAAPEADLWLLPWSGWLLVPWGVGTIVRLYRESAARAREEEARDRAYEERLRMAQEVHDVVGHGLSAINMQAGIALHVLEKRPEQAKLALDAIRQTSKDALADLRGTLAVFRQPETAGDRRPAPGLGELDGLVARMRDSGVPVEVAVNGERGGVPAAVDLAAYRIVQESLTNVLRHAGPAAAAVRVRYGAGAVDLEIGDSGRGGDPDGAESTSGHGIPGMRERATALGGWLTAGARPEGGFLVRAHLPYRESRA